ncbi:uncharacterized protein G2W53_013366 [Senna tora]|uniref:Uncharacterized protein n=1 Tax=Senna tora TaxID=362788 RepID=A0A834WR81_9FABA|nr:uncharacterized protein G2W53_013366 [Senna tora]
MAPYPAGQITSHIKLILGENSSSGDEFSVLYSWAALL